MPGSGPRWLPCLKSARAETGPAYHNATVRQGLCTGHAHTSLPHRLFQGIRRPAATTADESRLGSRGNSTKVSEHFWFTVLGPVRAQRGSTEIELGSRQQRAVLAVLLLRENGHASLSELIEAVWGTAPPRTAGQTIRTYIHRLRKSLGPAHDAGTSFIVSAGDGYALRVSPDQLDLSVFRQRVAMAEGAVGTGHHARAIAHLRDALDLWCGEPLAGIPGTYAMSQRNRLEALRLVAVERRINVEYELGRFGEATAELFDLVAKHP